MPFKLDAALENDSIFVGNLDCFQVRLMNDTRFFWLLIIPEIEDVTELHHLPDNKMIHMMRLATHLGKTIMIDGSADKINTATNGNIVSQFHLHVVGRCTNDPAWPAPVWGVGNPTPLQADVTEQRIQIIKAALVEVASTKL